MGDYETVTQNANLFAQLRKPLLAYDSAFLIALLFGGSIVASALLPEKYGWSPAVLLSLCVVARKTADGRAQWLQSRSLLYCCAVLLLFAVTVIPLFSIYFPNTIGATTVAAAGLLTFLAAAALLSKSGVSDAVFGLITALGSLGAAAQLIGVSERIGNAHNVGLRDIAAIRYTFPGMLPGIRAVDSSSILIVALSFGCIATVLARKPEHQILFFACSVLITVSGLATFLRGSYVALFMFVVISIILISRSSQLEAKPLVIRLLAITFTAILLAIALDPLAAIKTCGMAVTQSQLRSMSGRMSILHAALSMIRQHPVMGIGPNNFGYMHARCGTCGADRPFVGQVSNGFVEFALSYGIPAFAVLLTSMFLLLVTVFRKTKTCGDFRSQIILCFTISGLMAVAVREVFASSVLKSYVSSMLVALAAAIMIELPEPKSEIGRRINWRGSVALNRRWIAIAVMVCCIASTLVQASRSWIRHDAESHFAAGLREYRSDNLQSALAELGEAIEKSRSDAYFLSTAGLIQSRTVSGDKWLGLAAPLTGPLDQDSKERRIHAENYYRAALSVDPANGLFEHNLAWLAARRGDARDAQAYLSAAEQNDRQDSIFHVTGSIFALRQGAMENASAEASEALVISPRLINSPWFMELSVQFPEIANQSAGRAYRELSDQYRLSSSPILGAKLAAMMGTADCNQVAPLLHLALRELPTLAEGWVLQGSCLEKDGNVSAASQAFRIALFLEPLNLRANAAMCRIAGDSLDCNSADAISNGGLIFSKAAYEANRRYQSRVVVPDDVVPQGLLQYCAPMIQSPQLESIY